MTTHQQTKQLTVRDVPADVVEALREEAASHGQSINAIVRDALSEHVRRRRQQRQLAEGLHAMQELRERIARSHGGDLDDSVPLLREDRER